MTWLAGLALYAVFVGLCMLAGNDCLGMKHYGSYAPLPNQWFTVGVMSYRYGFNFGPIEQQEEYFVCLHLPIYGMRYQINWDAERWSQDCVYYGFNRGFRRFSLEIPPVAPGL